MRVMCKCLLRRRSTSSSSFQKSVFSFFSSVNAMRRRVQRKRFNNPKRRARVKTSNKKRVCRDARVISEKLWNKIFFFFGSHREENMQKCKSVPLWAREASERVFRLRVCVCAFSGVTTKKKVYVRVHSLSVCLSLYLLLFGLPPRSALSSFFDLF